MGISKSALREAALARRMSLDPQAAAEAAAQAAENALCWLGLTPPRTVALYAPVRGELDPMPLANRLSADGVQLLLPMVIDPHAALVFRAWLADDPLTPGYARIPEPRADAALLRPDVVVVPLAAFDRRCFRVGYGAGLYDRTLAALRADGDVRALGYAFSDQEVEVVPAEPFDEALDAIATEREVVTPRPLAEADEPAA